MAGAVSLPKLGTAPRRDDVVTRPTEQDAYEGIARALYSQGGGVVTLRQERILGELRTLLHVSQEQHHALISRVLSELERPPAEIDTSIVGDKEITLPTLSAFALKPAKVAAATNVPLMTKKRKAQVPAAPAAEEPANGKQPESDEGVSLMPQMISPPPASLAAAVPAPMPKVFKFESMAPRTLAPTPMPALAARAGVPAGFVSYFTFQPGQQ